MDVFVAMLLDLAVFLAKLVYCTVGFTITAILLLWIVGRAKAHSTTPRHAKPPQFVLASLPPYNARTPTAMTPHVDVPPRRLSFSATPKGLVRPSAPTPKPPATGRKHVTFSLTASQESAQRRYQPLARVPYRSPGPNVHAYAHPGEASSPTGEARFVELYPTPVRSKASGERKSRAPRPRPPPLSSTRTPRLPPPTLPAVAQAPPIPAPEPRAAETHRQPEPEPVPAWRLLKQARMQMLAEEQKEFGAQRAREANAAQATRAANLSAEGAGGVFDDQVPLSASAENARRMHVGRTPRRTAGRESQADGASKRGLKRLSPTIGLFGRSPLYFGITDPFQTSPTTGGSGGRIMSRFEKRARGLDGGDVHSSVTSPVTAKASAPVEVSPIESEVWGPEGIIPQEMIDQEEREMAAVKAAEEAKAAQKSAEAAPFTLGSVPELPPSPKKSATPKRVRFSLDGDTICPIPSVSQEMLLQTSTVAPVLEFRAQEAAKRARKTSQAPTATQGSIGAQVTAASGMATAAGVPRASGLSSFGTQAQPNVQIPATAQAPQGVPASTSTQASRAIPSPQALVVAMQAPANHHVQQASGFQQLSSGAQQTGGFQKISSGAQLFDHAAPLARSPVSFGVSPAAGTAVGLATAPVLQHAPPQFPHVAQAPHTPVQLGSFGMTAPAVPQTAPVVNGLWAPAQQPQPNAQPNAAWNAQPSAQLNQQQPQGLTFGVLAAAAPPQQVDAGGAGAPVLSGKLFPAFSYTAKSFSWSSGGSASGPPAPVPLHHPPPASPQQGGDGKRRRGSSPQGGMSSRPRLNGLGNAPPLQA